MTAEMKFFALLIVGNVLIVMVYVLYHRAKEKERKSYLIKAIMMLLCPVVGPLFLASSQLFLKLLFFQQIDLEDVIFSKARVESHMRANEERDKNMVPLEEAIAVSDRMSLRGLMLNVVSGNVSQSLGSISLALDSEDSEISHYAASVLQQELNAFRIRVQKILREMQQEETGKSGEYAILLIQYMNPVLEQKVFSDLERRNMTDILEKAGEVAYEADPNQITAKMYEAIILRLLQIKQFERCEKWCVRNMEQYPEELSSYTCKMKLYFTTGQREKFFQIMEILKKSNIVIDNETLNLIRIFQ